MSENSICCRYNADRFLALTDKASEIKGRESFVNARQTNRSGLSDNLSVKLGIYEIKDRSIPVELMCDRAVWVVDTIKGIYNQYIAVYDDKIKGILLREQAITDTMETALAEKQFTVYFQPKHSLSDDSMVGAEALVRWIHPEWGFMSPGEFIPLFEKNGFIRRLDEYVWESVCEKLHEWKTNGYSVVPVSVNVSRADIFQSDLVKTFCSLIEKYEIEPSLLHLEITESAYTDNPEQIISTVEELRSKGFIIEISKHLITIVSTNKEFISAHAEQFREYLGLCRSALKVHREPPEFLEMMKDFFALHGDVCQKTLPLSTYSMPVELAEILAEQSTGSMWKESFQRVAKVIPSLEQRMANYNHIDISPLNSVEDIVAGKVPIACPHHNKDYPFYTPETYIMHLKNILRLMDTYKGYNFIPLDPEAYQGYNLMVNEGGMALLSHGQNHSPMIMEFRRPEIVLACKEHLMRIVDREGALEVSRNRTKAQINALIKALEKAAQKGCQK